MAKDVPSTRPLSAKLGIKPGFAVCVMGAPRGFAGSLDSLPPGVAFTASPSPSCHLFVCFVRSARELGAHLVRLRESLDRQTLWIAWPKKTSGVASDLDGNIVRETGLAAGWVDFKVCAVDATWSGLAFKKRVRSR